MFYICHGTGWASILKCSTEGWNESWGNEGDYTIGHCGLTWYDKYDFLTYQFSIDDLYRDGIFFVRHDLDYDDPNNTRFGILRYNGSGFNTYQSLNPLDGWILRTTDEYVTGNFDANTEEDEVLLIAPREDEPIWAALKHYNGNGFNGIWSNSGNGWIDGMYLHPYDKYIRLDVDGDNVDELLIITVNGWAAVLKYYNNTWNSLWGNNGSGLVGGFNISLYGHWNASDFDSDGVDEILMYDTYYGTAVIKSFSQNSQTWPDLWNNNGSHYIGNWYFESSDNVSLGNFCEDLGNYYYPIDKEEGCASVIKFEYEESNWNNKVIDNNNYSVNIPDNFALFQNYPNPFNSSTVIQYYIPKSTNVHIVLYDMLGNEIKYLVNKFQNAGIYKFNFDAKDLSSGTYFYKLYANDFIQTKKCVIIK
jgi:hypothetical protein